MVLIFWKPFLMRSIPPGYWVFYACKALATTIVIKQT